MKNLLHVLYSGQGGLGTYFINFFKSDTSRRFRHYAFFYGIESLLPEYEAFCIANGIPYCYVPRSSKIDLRAVRKLKAFAEVNNIEFFLLNTFSLSLIHFFSFIKPWKIIAINHTPTKVKTKMEKMYTVMNHLVAYRMVYFYDGHFEEGKRNFPFLKFGKDSAIIPKSVDVKLFTPKWKEKTDGVFIIGITARIIAGKRHDLLIRAIADMVKSDAQVLLKIAGDGPEKRKLIDLASSLNVNSSIQFTGRLTQIELIEFYQSLDAYVHVSDGETVCYCIMEAQACGLPILASNVEGINTALVHGETALLFENSEESISEQLETLMEDKKLSKALSMKSRAISVDYNLKYNAPEELFKLI